MNGIKNSVWEHIINFNYTSISYELLGPSSIFCHFHDFGMEILKAQTGQF